MSDAMHNQSVMLNGGSLNTMHLRHFHGRPSSISKMQLHTAKARIIQMKSTEQND